jgi:hypothetical protein
VSNIYTICSSHDIADVLLKWALNTNQSINQSIMNTIWKLPAMSSLQQTSNEKLHVVELVHLVAKWFQAEEVEIS